MSHQEQYLFSHLVYSCSCLGAYGNDILHCIAERFDLTLNQHYASCESRQHWDITLGHYNLELDSFAALNFLVDGIAMCAPSIYMYIYSYLSSIFKKSRSAILRPAWNRWSISVYYFSVSNLVLVTMPCVYQDIYSFQVFTFRNVCLHQLPPLLSLFFFHECKAVSWHINHREQSADREEIELLSQSWFVRYSNDRRGCKAV